MTAADRLDRALRDVPSELLSDAEAEVLDDARSALSAIAALRATGTIVVFVGPSGSGKSHIVNLLTGRTVVETGGVRPTTMDSTAVGSVKPDRVAEWVETASLPAGVVLVDTPPWEHDRNTAMAALGSADVAILVISPSRYADRGVAEIAGELVGQPFHVVLNRVDVAGADLGRLTEAVEERFGSVFMIPEGARPRDLEPLLAALIADVPDSGAKERVLRTLAASTSRHVASALTARSVELGALESSIEAAPVDGSATVRTVMGEWEATKASLVDLVKSRRSQVDEAILVGSGGELAAKLLPSLPTWESSTFDRSLESWRTDLESSWRAHARIRWRRRAADDLIRRSAWRAGVNRDVALPSRLKRMVGDRLDEVVAASSADLDQVLATAIRDRHDDWITAAAMLGSYKPGELLTAADRFEAGCADG